MKKIFEVIRESNGEKENKVLRMGIRVRMAGYETLCPLTEPCDSYQGARVEVERLKRDLDDLLDQVEKAFQGDSSNGGLGLTAEMNAEQVWNILSKVADDQAFMRGFNGLEEARRSEVAEYILTKCNIFSGRAALFSTRYDESSGLME